MRQLPLNIQLDKSATFSNFYTSGNEQLVHLLKNISSVNPSFIYIWGSEGMGKSHLAQALCHQVFSLNQTTAYFPLTLAGLHPDVLEGIEDNDLVCLDDVEFVINNSDWAEKLFNLFNDLKANQKSLVVFSQSSPQNIELSLADLRSRFMSMEIYRIKSIADEEQIDFVQALGDFRGMDIPLEVCQFLILRCGRAIPELVNMIDKLDGQSLAHKRKITIPFVKEILYL